VTQLSLLVLTLLVTEELGQFLESLGFVVVVELAAETTKFGLEFVVVVVATYDIHCFDY
jgi:hypothetical protein